MMESALLVSNMVLWIAMIALGVAVLALTRQIGILYERVAPAGALMVGQGPKVGETAPEFELENLNGQKIHLGGVSASARTTLLFFLSPTCPVCNTLLPVLKSMRRSESKWLDVILASDGEQERQEAFIKKKELREFPYILSMELGMTYQVANLPFGVLLDEEGVVRAKGLVNSREHLESLFEAKERGVASIQEYLSDNEQELNIGERR